MMICRVCNCEIVATKPELVLIIILCMINIGIIFGSGYIPNMQIRLYVAWFYTLLIIMLCR